MAALSWKYIDSQVLSGSANIENCLDAICGLFKSTTYEDGTARVPGTSAAWDPTLVLDGSTPEAVILSAPDGHSTPWSNAQKIIFAGSDTTHTPPMVTNAGGSGYSQTWSDGYMLCSIAKNPGAFDAWDATEPFTSGGFMGYCRLFKQNYNTATLYAYETTDAVAVFQTYGPGESREFEADGCIIGGLWDPGSTSGSDAEDDGYLYGMCASGGQVWAADWAQDYRDFPGDMDSSNKNMSLYYKPGDAIETYGRCGRILDISNPDGRLGGMVAASGRFGRVPLFYCNSDTQIWIGRLREIWYFSAAFMGEALYSGGVVQGFCTSYYASGKGSATQTSLLFTP